MEHTSLAQLVLVGTTIKELKVLSAMVTSALSLLEYLESLAARPKYRLYTQQSSGLSVKEQKLSI